MDINNVIAKYHYEGALAEFLPKLYQEFINYFGKAKEPIIYEALLNTKIIACNNVYTALNERGLIERSNNGFESAVGEGDLKRAAGVYHSLPNITYDPNSYQYNIEGAKRLVAINTSDFNSEYSKTVLIHELSHLIKSYYEEYSIDNGVLTSRSGLITTQEKLSIQNDCLVKTPILEESVGLEEGLTSIVEEDIAKVLVNPNYKVSGYGVVTAIARLIMDKFQLKEDILNAQILNDKKGLIQKFDGLLPNFYERLSILMDRIYKLSLKMFSEMLQPEKMKATSNIINEVINNEFQPLLKEVIQNQESRRN